MGKSGGTWKKGEKPPVQKPKGVKHRKTRLRESLGINSWADLQGWVEGPGIKMVITELAKLKGKALIDGYAKLAEYVKPKLQRTEHTGTMQVNNYNVDLSKEDVKSINQTLENEC